MFWKGKKEGEELGQKAYLKLNFCWWILSSRDVLVDLNGDQEPGENSAETRQALLNRGRSRDQRKQKKADTRLDPRIRIEGEKRQKNAEAAHSVAMAVKKQEVRPPSA